ncbi:MAG TPA: FtsX-like permease family protein, partial [Rhodocyclaceae bacterium]|nr:FtsX-like permease family protein [Rhodocyclaceae bacterium]
ADIAILRTLGASPRSVMTIFVVQGAVIGAVGLLAGLGLGLLLAANLDYAVPLIERLTGVTLWSKEVYPLAQLPVRVVWTDVAIVLAIALLLTLIATLYPSLRAARVDPAEALRHE